ncbi:hypothetical protein AVEN_230567-1 [Araneus ventricosus]|uniref:Uncharacterized protein n=1 Tax=Araneus ventricosus TaxID=182803 RepID=A0A4Y2GH97_ARAVE|nr:hypothetical protein AVEN_230567-1 [Araneus ventricosus]
MKFSFFCSKPVSCLFSVSLVMDMSIFCAILGLSTEPAFLSLDHLVVPVPKSPHQNAINSPLRSMNKTKVELGRKNVSGTLPVVHECGPMSIQLVQLL